MALFIRQSEERSKLQERIASELQDRAKQRTALDNRPDGVSDSQYLKGTRQTSPLAWAWILIIILAVGACVWLTIVSMTR